MRSTWVLTIWLFVGVAATLAANGADEAVERPPLLLTTESRIERASLVRSDADRKLSFQREDGEIAIPLGKIVRWGNFVRANGGHRLRLLHGGELVGNSIAIHDRHVTLESDLLGGVDLPRELVTAVVFDVPADESSARELQRQIDAADRKHDTLLLTNGDRLNGEVVSLLKENITFKSEADFAIDRSRVAAVVFGRKPARERPTGVTTWIGLRDGSRFLADRFILKDKKATSELASGITIGVNGDAIVALQPIGGDVEYVSDRDDDGFRHIPFLSLEWGYHRDRNVTGGPLIADGRRYLKGLGMHSAARITYDLDDEYRAFQAELAIDGSTGERGSVTCRVFVDEGSGKWTLKYESPVIRGGDKPIPVDVQLAGVKRISLLVDFADHGDVLDHINWLDTRLVK